jgi:NAD(P)-dependent dehydrogenase (short-subunit alcohol dehydrogenase family)
MPEHKRVLITGVNRGLGRSLVDVFLEAGFSVAGITRQSCDRWADNDRYLGVVADISDWEAVRAAVHEVSQKFGGIDYLINNAAVYSRISFLEEPANDWTRDVLISLAGSAYLMKAVLPLMIADGFGRVYNVGSFADLSPIENSSAYSTAKGGLHALTKSVAADLAPLELDIQVHEWMPGHLNTRMSDFTGIDPSTPALWILAIIEADNATSKSVVFQNDQELVWNRSLGSRIRSKLMFWRRA